MTVNTTDMTEHLHHLTEQDTTHAPETHGQDVGYTRVSTLVQSTERQLEGVPLDTLFSEKCSAKQMARPELDACKQHCRQGDTLHIHSIDRVCRSGVDDLVRFVKEMTAKGVNVKFHKDGLEFFGGESMSATQKGILGILAVVAQMEREMSEERRKEGVAIAAQAGRKAGRKGVSEETVKTFTDMVNNGKSVGKAAETLGIGRSTAYRLKKRIDERKAAAQ